MYSMDINEENLEGIDDYEIAVEFDGGGDSEEGSDEYSGEEEEETK